jgi:uroporphyrin-III C-methyltransferase/precorrin-2 dehydrogenase/sirohydrochlorin ferrochelatase
MSDLLPLFLNLTGRAVLLVGGGRVAAGKLTQLLAAGAHVRVVAPEICDEMAAAVAQSAAGEREGLALQRITIAPRRFVESDLDDVWLVVAAATPDANRDVATLAEPRRLFVNAVDDPPNATAYLSGVVRRDGVTLAISTSGDAPALTSLLREALDAVLPRELASWIALARAERVVWRRDGVPMEARKPRLLRALNDLYGSPKGLRDDQGDHRLRDDEGDRGLQYDEGDRGRRPGKSDRPLGDQDAVAQATSPGVPWLNAPEDSWL